ncbi:26068_t:CDS:2, partial [Gigaspora rosea]
ELYIIASASFWCLSEFYFILASLLVFCKVFFYVGSGGLGWRSQLHIVISALSLVPCFSTLVPW